jgi:NitT/TauT family transport system substrate-binding protein
MEKISRRRLLVALGMAACASLGSRHARAAQKLEISQYGQFISGFPWLIALKKGFLRDEGLDIDSFISSAGGGTSVRNLLASGLPFGEVSSGAAISAIKQGIGLMLVYAATNNSGEIAWMTTPDKPINSIKDLVGRTVGYTSPKSTTEIMLRMSLAKAGIRPDQVKFVATGGLGGALSMLKTGNIDAAPFVDPNLTKHENEFKLVFRAADYTPPFHFTFGITTPEMIAGKPDMIRKLINARRRAVDWIYANPQGNIDFCAEFFEIDRPLAAKLFPKFLQGDPPYWSRGNFTQAGLDSNIAGLHLIGALEGSIDWKTHVDQRFLPKDLPRIAL